MDLYDEKEHVISSDEYSDYDDDDDALMNDAVSAQHHNRSSEYTNQNKPPKCKVDQKQKELSSLIRRNKISVIYKNKSIKWLNNKRKRERYKERIYINGRNDAAGHVTSDTRLSLEQEKQKVRNYKSSDQKYDTMDIQEIINIEDNNNKEMLEEKEEVLPTISTLQKSTYNTRPSSSIQQKNEKSVFGEKTTHQEKKNVVPVEKLKTDNEQKSEISRKRMRSSSPSSVLNENTEASINHNEKICRMESPEFYKNINDAFPKFDKIATNYVDTIVNTSLIAVENKMKSLSNELDTLNEILKAKELEWNRLLHLKMVKEEIHSRLNKKWQILQLKESLGKKQGQHILLELKELESYLSDKKPSSDFSDSSITIKKLVENRANMNADDLKREKCYTSRLHSLLVAQNMLHASESLENLSDINNGEKNNMVLTSKNSEIYNHSDGGRLLSNNNKGRQGEVRDVKSLIADFRQKNPELLPRVGKRIKSTESNTQRQGYSIPLLEKDQKMRAQYFSKDRQCGESYLFPNSVNEISLGCSKKLSSSNDIDFVNVMNNHYNVRAEDKLIKSQMKAEYEAKCSKNFQYPLCQECKSKESRFVCAGCGKQWYCSKNCQISAWDKHSDQCTE